MNGNELNTGLNGNMTDFFADEEGSEKGNHPLGVLGTILLHVVAVGLAIYSAYHGIHATSTYRAAQGLGNVSGIVGITVNELTVIGVYLAFFYSQIIGKVQQYIAATTIAIGVIIMALGIVGDSQLQAHLEMSPWLQSYLMWLLPVSPVIMAVLAGLTLASDPRVLRRIKVALNRNQAAEKRHVARMKAEDAHLAIAQSTANVQLNTLQMTNQYVLDAYRSPLVQEYVQRAAINVLPDILRGAGVFVPYGTVIEGQTIEPPPDTPIAQPAQPAPLPHRSWLDRVLGRNESAAATSVENPIHNAPRQDGAAAAVPEVTPGQGASPRLHPDDIAAIAVAMLAAQATAPAPVPTAVHANGQEATGNGGTPRP